MGKYTLELGDSAHKDKLTFYAGYSHIEKEHADYTVGAAQGNYQINVGININDSAVYNMEWLGARYAMSSGLNLTGAFYHITQNSWTIGLERAVWTTSAAVGRACCAPAPSRRCPWLPTTSSTSTTTYTGCELVGSHRWSRQRLRRHHRGDIWKREPDDHHVGPSYKDLKGTTWLSAQLRAHCPRIRRRRKTIGW